MQGGPVDEFLDVAVECPALYQVEVEVGRATPQFWMNMQASYDLKTEAEVIHDELAAIREMEAA